MKKKSIPAPKSVNVVDTFGRGYYKIMLKTGANKNFSNHIIKFINYIVVLIFMATEKQYVIPVLGDAENTWPKIHMLTQPLKCLYDEHGNLKNCGFGKVQNKWLGEFYVFQSLDKKVAETVREMLITDSELTVLPLGEVMYRK